MEIVSEFYIVPPENKSNQLFDTNCRNEFSTYLCTNDNYDYFSLDIYGTAYTESLIVHLGENYYYYSNEQRRINPWLIENTFEFTLGTIGMLKKKKKCPSVTGNIGESLAVPVLFNCIDPNQTVKFARLTSKHKCPDFLISVPIGGIETAWNLTACAEIDKSQITNIPTLLPLEVKSTASNSSSRNGFPIEAYEQLDSYWSECPSDKGFGIVARIVLNEAPKVKIRYYLILQNCFFSNRC